MDKALNDREIAVELRVAIARLVKLMRRETNNDENLSLTERSVLGALYTHTALLPSELAAMEKITAQSISQIINKLDKCGYINKKASADDKRKVIITISATGKKIVSEKRQEKQEWLAHAISNNLTAKEKKVLTETIDVLKKLVDTQTTDTL